MAMVMILTLPTVSRGQSANSGLNDIDSLCLIPSTGSRAAGPFVWPGLPQRRRAPLPFGMTKPLQKPEVTRRVQDGGPERGARASQAQAEGSHRRYD